MATLEEYHNGYSEDVDDLAPLVVGSSSSLLAALEIEPALPLTTPRRSRRRTPYSWISTLSCTSKLIVSVLVASAAVIPFLAGFFLEDGDYRDDVWNPELQVQVQSTCAQLKYNQTFEELMQEIQDANPTDLCEASLVPDSKDCECLSPLAGAPMIGMLGKKWSRAFQLEKQRVANATSSSIEVAFVGDSITEHWLGTSFGNTVPKLQEIVPVFQKLFTRAGGSEIDGIVLGISSERCRNVLYRLQNGLLGNDLRPKVFWLLIGTNDLGHVFCSVEAIVAGNIAIIQEIKKLRPDATVVVNSLLPRVPTNWTAWISLSEINHRLECYASMTEGVKFFNATDMFMDSDGTIHHLPDALHPDAEGYKRWGTAILEKVLEVLS
jgi:lysophospholipase L1-like esterase